jgi:hypothetical protein
MPYNLKHGMSFAPEYQVYATAKDRCTNPNSQRWESHGARGIEFRFPSFEVFYEHIGKRPEGDYSLERIDNNGHYELGNVKWATRSEQQKNKRTFTRKVRHGKGFYRHKASGKLMVRVRFFNRMYYVGLFVDEEPARKAYEDKLEELRKEHEQCVSGVSCYHQTKSV